MSLESKLLFCFCFSCITERWKWTWTSGQLCHPSLMHLNSWAPWKKTHFFMSKFCCKSPLVRRSSYFCKHRIQISKCQANTRDDRKLTLFLGGISQEAVLSHVKFVETPFTLSIIATPPFIKPGLPYAMRVRILLSINITVYYCILVRFGVKLAQ